MVYDIWSTPIPAMIEKFVYGNYDSESTIASPHLVGGLEHGFHFSIIYGIILPN